jgi:hypothetical protein
LFNHCTPDFTNQNQLSGGAIKLCTIESNLSSVQQNEFVEKGKHFWSGKKHHFRAEYAIRVIVAPADLKFELYFKGVKFSRNHDPISVEWDKEGAALKPKEEQLGADVAGLRGFY